MNVLDYEYNKKVKSFFNLIYHCNFIPTINKPLRVGKHSPMSTDQIIRDYVLTWDFKTAILKTDLTDQFSIVMMGHLSKIRKLNIRTDGPIFRVHGQQMDYQIF